MLPGRPLLATTVRPEGAAPLDMASGTGEDASNPMSEARLQVAGLPLPRGILGEEAPQSVSAQQRAQFRDPPAGGEGAAAAATTPGSVSTESEEQVLDEGVLPPAGVPGIPPPDNTRIPTTWGKESEDADAAFAREQDRKNAACADDLFDSLAAEVQDRSHLRIALAVPTWVS